ncbi:Uncharacterized protein TCAP_02784 [Tolypocladium capitatum]|uniref:BTB domain-containing protein n=1 Tax=Tolypocladium capitatum TaxID=45235 RepID=A0A2K3QIE2_9HYPO|nr:Uncharacterized protein TCAP_02784 [Tolypocladium capitatum]
MPRTSLDGRGRKALDGSSKSDEQAWMYRPRKSFPTNLKEASPPKTNPWRSIKPPPPRAPSPKTPSPKQQSPTTPSLKQRSPKSDNSLASPDRDETPRTSCANLAERRVSSNPSPPRQGSCQRGKAPATFEQQRSHSASPRSSRALFQAAAPRAGERHAHCIHQPPVLKVHRNILVRGSGWFRDGLPPPGRVSLITSGFDSLHDASTDADQGGAPVEVLFPGEARIVSHSLKFLYTGLLRRVAYPGDAGLEPCEFNHEKPHDIANIACCSLFYHTAVHLRAKAIACHVLHMLECTAKKWWEFLDAHFAGWFFGRDQGAAFGVHLRNALDAAYGYPEQHVVGPLRLALAGFLDVVLPLIVRQPEVVDLLCTRTWQRYSRAITADLVEFRRRRGGAQIPNGVTHDEATIEALLESNAMARRGAAARGSGGGANSR